MKTQVTLTIDADVKEKFQALAKKMGSNMSTLTNMYYTHVIQTGHVEYRNTENQMDVEMGFIPYEELSSEDKRMYKKIQKMQNHNFINI